MVPSWFKSSLLLGLHTLKTVKYYNFLFYTMSHPKQSVQISTQQQNWPWSRVHILSSDRSSLITFTCSYPLPARREGVSATPIWRRRVNRWGRRRTMIHPPIEEIRSIARQDWVQRCALLIISSVSIELTSPSSPPVGGWVVWRL